MTTTNAPAKHTGTCYTAYNPYPPSSTSMENVTCDECYTLGMASVEDIFCVRCTRPLVHGSGRIEVAIPYDDGDPENGPHIDWNIITVHRACVRDDDDRVNQ